MNLGELEGVRLDGPAHLSGAIGDAGYRLLTYMAWPTNLARRNQFMAAQGAQALVQIKSSVPADLGICLLPGTDWEVLKRFSYEQVALKHFEPFGGLQSVIDGPSPDQFNREIEKGLVACLAVGKILDTARRIAEYHKESLSGGSVNKAVAILDRVKSNSGKRTVLMEHWKTHSRVAHIGAAFAAAMALAKIESAEFQTRMYDGLWYREGIGVTLALALDYERFGREYRARAQTAPILPAFLWNVPKGLRLPDSKPPMGRLVDELANELREYKAPKFLAD